MHDAHEGRPAAGRLLERAWGLHAYLAGHGPELPPLAVQELTPALANLAEAADGCLTPARRFASVQSDRFTPP